MSISQLYKGIQTYDQNTYIDDITSENTEVFKIINYDIDKIDDPTLAVSGTLHPENINLALTLIEEHELIGAKIVMHPKSYKEIVKPKMESSSKNNNYKAIKIDNSNSFEDIVQSYLNYNIYNHYDIDKTDAKPLKTTLNKWVKESYPEQNIKYLKNLINNSIYKMAHIDLLNSSDNIIDMYVYGSNQPNEVVGSKAELANSIADSINTSFIYPKINSKLIKSVEENKQISEELNTPNGKIAWGKAMSEVMSEVIKESLHKYL